MPKKNLHPRASFAADRFQEMAYQQGISLSEILVALSIIGVIATLAVGALLRTDRAETASHQARDFAQHLAAAYNIYTLRTGLTVRNSNNPDGIGAFLKGWETVVEYTAGPPEYLKYPSGLIVYLKPEQVPGIPDPIYSGTDNRDWLLVDYNGLDGPNQLGTSGDRLLFYVDNPTGRVMSAWQLDSDSFAASFYDVHWVQPELAALSTTGTTATTSTTTGGTTGCGPDPTCSSGIWLTTSCTCDTTGGVFTYST